AREGGRQLPLVLAEEVDADVVAGRDGGPGGTAGGDPEGEHRRVGGDGGERGGGEADRSPVAPRGDHRDARRVLPEDGAQQAGRAGPGGAEVGGCRHEPSFCGWNSGWCGRARQVTGPVPAAARCVRRPPDGRVPTWGEG